MPLATMQAPTSQAGAGAKPLIPFGRAAKRHGEQGQTFANNPWAAGQQQFLVPAYGYLSASILTIAAISGAGVAAVYGADAPWNVLSNILLQDTNGTPIINLTGYQAYLARKWGGYRLFKPDGVNPPATNLTKYAFEAGQTTGNFKAPFELFNEFARDGLGCLQNMDASAAYKVTATFNSPAAGTGANNVYSTSPTTVPTLTSTLEMLGRSKPTDSDLNGNPQKTTPPAAGSVGYWSAQTFAVAAGSNTFILTRVGNLIRNHILVFRDATGNRLNADTTGVTPTVLEFDWDSGQRYILNVATMRSLIGFDLNGFDVDDGVIPIQNITDPEGIPGGELGWEWLPTVGATKLQLRFTSTAAGSLDVITNDIVPGSATIYSELEQE